jgi:hypothetical protein
MGLEHGFETLFGALLSAVGSTKPVRDRLAEVVSLVGHLEHDSFSDDETWYRFQSFLAENTMVVKRDDGSWASKTSQMSDEEAIQWLQDLFVLFADVASAYSENISRAA